MTSGTCQYCGKVCEDSVKRHEQLCGKNPNRRSGGFKKGHAYIPRKVKPDDKTDAITSRGASFISPSAASELHSNILAEINLKGEFDKMATKLNKKEEKKESKADMKYECGECGHQFNHKAEGGLCPGCGCELE